MATIQCSTVERNVNFTFAQARFWNWTPTWRKRYLHSAASSSGLAHEIAKKCYNYKKEFGREYMLMPYMRMMHACVICSCFGLKNVELLRPGLLRLIQGCLRIMEDGVIHGGPPCSSWVWMNRGTSCRSTTKVFGNEKEPSVKLGNKNFGV